MSTTHAPAGESPLWLRVPAMIISVLVWGFFVPTDGGLLIRGTDYLGAVLSSSLLADLAWWLWGRLRTGAGDPALMADDPHVRAFWTVGLAAWFGAAVVAALSRLALAECLAVGTVPLVVCALTAALLLRRRRR